MADRKTARELMIKEELADADKIVTLQKPVKGRAKPTKSQRNKAGSKRSISGMR